MENHEKVAVAGSNGTMFLSTKPMVKKLTNFPTGYEEIRCKLLFESPIMHPAVIMRKDVLMRENYRYKLDHKAVEDYGLWVEIAKKYEVVNLPERLLNYRIVPSSITNQALKNMGERVEIIKRVYTIGLKYLGVKFSEEELDIHAEIALSSTLKHFKYTKKSIENWLNKLIEINDENKKYSSEIFKKEIGEQFFRVCIYNGTYNEYKKSEFSKYNPKSVLTYMKAKASVKIKQLIR
jgi:hypothetical protein